MIQLHIGRQTFDFDCGPKALQTVMAYYGVETREDELIKALGTGQEGTPVSAMIALSEQYGFRVEAGEHWNLQEVKRFVDEGNPVIVLLQAWADRYMSLAEWRCCLSTNLTPCMQIKLTPLQGVVFQFDDCPFFNLSLSL